MRIFGSSVLATSLQTAVFLFSLWHFLRAFSAWERWQTLQALGAAPAYWLISGLAAGGLWLTLLIFLLREARYAPLMGLLLCLMQFAAYWLERWLMQVSPLNNLPYAVVFSVALFIFFGAGFLWQQFLVVSISKEEKA